MPHYTPPRKEPSYEAAYPPLGSQRSTMAAATAELGAQLLERLNIGQETAGPNKIVLGVDQTGLVKYKPQTHETAARTSELLTMNHKDHHIFFNENRFHNHISHNLLTLYGLGAPTSVIEPRYKDNKYFQKPMVPAGLKEIDNLSNPEDFKSHLGEGAWYHNYLRFFEIQIANVGYQNVVNEFLFSKTPEADDLLCRMFAGALHPIIHLGFGIEFEQPAIVAEALAMAAVHDAWIGSYLLSAEKSAPGYQGPTKTIPQLLEDIQNDKKLRTAAQWNDANQTRLRDGVMKRAGDEMIIIAARWKCPDLKVEEKTVEMINAAVYMAAAAQHPPNEVKFDFQLLHLVTASTFWTCFSRQDWISGPSKSRLLRFKVYTDLAIYASRGAPLLDLTEIVQYIPKDMEKGSSEWPGIFNRLIEQMDDGHAIKLARSVKHAEEVSKDWEAAEWCKVKAWMFLKVGEMVADSVEGIESRDQKWVLGAGFEEAWEGVPERPKVDANSRVANGSSG